MHGQGDLPVAYQSHAAYDWWRGVDVYKYAVHCRIPHHVRTLHPELHRVPVNAGDCVCVRLTLKYGEMYVNALKHYYTAIVKEDTLTYIYDSIYCWVLHWYSQKGLARA